MKLLVKYLLLDRHFIFLAGHPRFGFFIPGRRLRLETSCIWVNTVLLRFTIHFLRTGDIKYTSTGHANNHGFNFPTVTDLNSSNGGAKASLWAQVKLYVGSEMTGAWCTSWKTLKF
jgi:hypothetical protein